MSLQKLVDRLEEIQDAVSSLFRDQFNGMENDAITWVVGPWDQRVVSSIYAWFAISDADVTHDVLQSLFLTFEGRRPPNWKDAPFLSSVASRLQAVARSMQDGSQTWTLICKARQDINLSPGGLTREDFWRYRAFAEKAKESLLTQVATARINLQEIKDIVETARGLQDPDVLMDIRCPITGQHCDLTITASPRQVFVAFQFVSGHYKTSSFKAMVSEALQGLRLSPFFPDEHYEPVHISCEICHTIQQSAICMFEVSDSNPNVMFELGLAYMLGKLTILLGKRGSPGTQIADIAGIHRIEYEDLVECRENIIRYLEASEAVKKLLRRSNRDEIQ